MEDISMEEELAAETCGGDCESDKQVVESTTTFDFELLRAKIEKSYKQISISRKMRKFFRRRYHLFNRFDSGILMDTESWYSVTPEAVAAHIAFECRRRMNDRVDLTILDAFCGSGGNTIQFARHFDHVIASDIDFVKLQCAQENARIYGQSNRVSFVQTDFFHLHKTLNLDDRLNIDVIFLSPPWGGIMYNQTRESDLSEMPLDAFSIFLYCKNQLKCRNLVFFLPRNANLNQIMYMAGPGGQVVIEQNFLDHKLVAISCYYGDLSSNQA